jgi:hypothetical protein
MIRLVKTRLTVYAILSACTALLCSATGHAMPPQRVELTFDINYGAMKLGVGRDVLAHDGKHYEVISETIPKGIAAIFIKDIRRKSRGTITDNGLKPESFEEHGRKGGARAASFDWPNEKLLLVDGESNQSVSLPRNTIDQASLPYGFAFAGSVPASFAVHVTDGRRLTEYRYRIVGRERLTTVLGEMDAIHVEKVREPDDKRSFDFWLGVDHHYLPVKMRFIEKGRAFDSIVTTIKYP